MERIGTAVASVRLRREVVAGAYRDGIVISARFDGFGMRVGELLNAQRLATALGARFGFVWRERAVDGVRPVEEVFAPEFVAEHHLGDTALGEFREVRGAVTRSDLAALRDRSTRGLWLETKHADRREDRFRLRGAGVHLPPGPPLGQLFDELPLSGELSEIRDQVRGTRVSDEVVVHVRRGDVVRGDFRFGGSFADKAIPLPVLAALEANLRSRGMGVVHVGPAVESLGLRGIPVPVAVSRAVDPGLARVVHDFCALSTARQVVAGSSAFARVATLVGDVRIASVSDFLDPATVESAILSFIREQSAGELDPEFTLACSYLLRIRRGTLEPNIRAEVLRALIRVDDEDPAPVLARASMLVAEGRVGQAESLLATKLPGRRADTLVRLLRVSRRLDSGLDIGVMSGATMLTADWDVIANSNPSTPWLSFILGVNDFGLTGSAEARRRLLAAQRDLDDPAVLAAAEVADPSLDDSTEGGSVFRPTPRDLLGR